MPFQISYWTASRTNPNVPGGVISSEQRTISGTSAQSGTTPANAVFTKISATEGGYFAYDSAGSVAVTGTGAYLAAGEVSWQDAFPGYKVAGIT